MPGSKRTVPLTTMKSVLTIVGYVVIQLFAINENVGAVSAKVGGAGGGNGKSVGGGGGDNSGAVGGGSSGGGGGAGGVTNHMGSCSMQSKCITFTYETILSNLKCGGEIEYRVCAKLDLSKPECRKSGTVSHTCVKNGSTCATNAVGFKGTAETKSIANGHIQCQIAKPGSSLQFLFKDGPSCADSGMFKPTNGNEIAGTCMPRPGDVTSCTGNGVGMECIWNINVPIPSGGGGGDPHFRTYDGTKYSFHGQCDLLLASSPGFGSGLGLHVHARTEIVSGWSLISNAAVKIGNDILEVGNDGSHYFNGERKYSLDFLLAETYGISKISEVLNGENMDVYSIILGTEKVITIANYKKMISIRVDAVLLGTKGMLGINEKIGMVGRDLKTVLNDPNEMGSQWQVRDDEPMLFHEHRAPQYPARCVLPETQSRQLRIAPADLAKAEEACANTDQTMREFCVHDVLLIGDTDVAHGYGFAF